MLTFTYYGFFPKGGAPHLRIRLCILASGNLGVSGLAGADDREVAGQSAGEDAWRRGHQRSRGESRTMAGIFTGQPWRAVRVPDLTPATFEWRRRV